MPLVLGIVRAGRGANAIEGHDITASLRRHARLHLDHGFRLEGGDGDDAEHGHTHAEMRQCRAEG